MEESTRVEKEEEDKLRLVNSRYFMCYYVFVCSEYDRTNESEKKEEVGMEIHRLDIILTELNYLIDQVHSFSILYHCCSFNKCMLSKNLLTYCGHSKLSKSVRK